MGRIRSIKPEFPQSESIGKLSRDARLLFIQLWTLVDDSGRTRAASRMLASLLYPYDGDAPSLLDGWMAELERGDHVRRYVVDGCTYLEIINFLKHQKIDKPSASKLPAFAESSAKPREESAKPRESSTTDQEGIKEGIKDLKPSPAQKRGRGNGEASPSQPAGPVPVDPPVPPDPKPPKPSTKNEMREKRHAELKAAISAYWQFKNPNDAMPWDGAEGKNLGIWMQASPDTTIEQFRQYLVNRSRSEVNHAERPSKWIRNITDYAAGPLDRFNKPLKRGGYANGPPSAEAEAYERKVKAIMAERKAHS